MLKKIVVTVYHRVLSNFVCNDTCKLFNLGYRYPMHFRFSAESQTHVHLIDAWLP